MRNIENNIYTVVCRICGSHDSVKLINWDEYTIHLCNGCNLIFASPLPSDQTLFEYYQGFLYKIPSDFEVDSQIKDKKNELIHLFSLG